jgi:ligand-binding sensor domain-containing protein
MRKILLLLLVFPFFLFGQNKSEVKYFSENNTGFPISTLCGFFVSGNNFILGYGNYNKYNPGGVTYYDGTYWTSVTKGDENFPFTDVSAIFRPENTQKLYVYGRPYSNSYYYWITKYDESESKWVNLGDSSTFQAVNGITDLCETDNGEIYAAGTGFYKVLPDTFIYLHPEGQPLYHADYIRLRNNGTLYLTSGGAISIYSPSTNSFEQVFLDSIQTSFPPLLDSSDNLWLTDNNKVVKYSWGGAETVFRNPFTDINLNIYFVTSNQNDLWMLAGDVNSGDKKVIVKFNIQNHTWEKYDFEDPLYSWNRFEKLKVTDNYIYAYNADGLFKFDKSSLQLLNYWNQQNTGIPGEDITSIVIDKNKHYWFNSLNYGISLFNGDVWNTQDSYHINGSNMTASWDMCVDNQNRIFLVGDSVYYYEGGVWNSAKPSNSFYASSVAFDINGNIWIADNYTGLCKYTGGEFTYYTTSNSGIPGNDPYKVFVDKENNLWIGFRNSGIAMYDGGTFHVYNNGLPQNVVNDFAQSPDGTIWAALLGGGVAKFSGGSWTLYNSNNSGLFSDNVRTIAYDNNGNLWIGNNDPNPLFVTKYDGTNWEKVMIDSTTSSGILDIAVDDNNNIFISAANLPVFVLNENNVVLSADNFEHPENFALYQNYPNPFNPTTTIKYSIPTVIARSGATRQSHETYASVQLKVYDSLGREVATLVNQKQAPGNYTVQFDASKLASGVYFYKLQSGSFVATKKMILLR